MSKYKSAALSESDLSEQDNVSCPSDCTESAEESVVTVVAKCGDIASTPPRKKLKRLVTYKKDWEGDFVWLQSVKGNAFKGFCTICRKEFSVGHGGKGDVVHHSQRSVHKKSEIAVNTKAINRFFVRSERRSTLDQQVYMRLFLASETGIIVNREWRGSVDRPTRRKFTSFIKFRPFITCVTLLLAFCFTILLFSCRLINLSSSFILLIYLV